MERSTKPDEKNGTTPEPTIWLELDDGTVIAGPDAHVAFAALIEAAQGDRARRWREWRLAQVRQRPQNGRTEVPGPRRVTPVERSRGPRARSSDDDSDGDDPPGEPDSSRGSHQGEGGCGSQFGPWPPVDHAPQPQLWPQPKLSSGRKGYR